MTIIWRKREEGEDMKRYMEMAGGALGVVAFVTLVAILITLFQGQQAIHRILT